MTAPDSSSWKLMYLHNLAGVLVLVLCKQRQTACAQHGDDAAYIDAVLASGAVMRELALLFMSCTYALLTAVDQGHCVSAHNNGQQRVFCTLITKDEASDLLVFDADIIH